ncbi:hypothetical protein ACIGB8_10455 [Promicromonospora sukumoe]|uniref:Uncharacterized protein n=1 Tax=Promicromonospora sukumoe TaxID=88382 RepID=A0A7W3J5J1_9MICO|nr:hypothetical protein [Promicromonospora sukumoe]MBA8806633.1 hypothetical protein [Promicromonospora sukumoe]
MRDWEVRSLQWAMVPRSREAILGWEEAEWKSSIVMLAVTNGGEYGVGEWDEETFGMRGIVGVDTIISLALYEAVLIPELNGRRDGVLLQQCADFLEAVLDGYYDLVERWVVDIAGYFEGNPDAWAAFQVFAGPLFMRLLKAEGLR